MLGWIWKSFLTLYINIKSLKLTFIQNRLSGAFQTRLFSYKEICDTIYILFWLVVVIDLERLWKAYRYSVLLVTLRVYINRRRWWGVWDFGKLDGGIVMCCRNDWNIGWNWDVEMNCEHCMTLDYICTIARW